MERKGILLAGGSGTRLHPCTQAVCKQLLPIYDKPLVYYPLSVLMLTGIRDILIISTPRDLPVFERLFGDGHQLGIRLEYAAQPSPDGLAQALIIAEDFLAGAPSCLILGDNLFFGHDLVPKMAKVDEQIEGATVFGYAVADPERYGVVEFDADGRAIGLEEKPLKPKSNYAVTGLYFYDNQAPALARTLKPSARGELEITDLNRRYLEKDQLRVEFLGRGTAWMDTGTPLALLHAAQFVEVIQNRQGMAIACLEEIAWRRGWIGDEELRALGEVQGKSTYGGYIQRILNERGPGTAASDPWAPGLPTPVPSG
ncbi:MAG: glucose-1-phosphate thymidylyltransferase RfbA [Opitutales bacterium]